MLLPSILLVALAFGLTLLWLELRHRLRPASPLRLSSGAWRVQRLITSGGAAEQGEGASGSTVEVSGSLTLRNPQSPAPALVPQPAENGKTNTRSLAHAG